MDPTFPVPSAPSLSMPQAETSLLQEAGWSPPSTICPPGLEYLMVLNQMLVHQQKERTDLCNSWKILNKYKVMNLREESIFNIVEESGACERFFSTRYRRCEFFVTDGYGKEVLHMVCPFKCWCCCCSSCMQEIEVYSGDTLLGSVMQDATFFENQCSIRNEHGKIVLIMKAPIFRCGIDMKFKIKSTDGKHNVGEIKHKSTVDMYKFEINFPIDLDVKMKAVLLGACILSDLLYLEPEKRRDATSIVQI